jgi:hypothetical protein
MWPVVIEVVHVFADHREGVLARRVALSYRRAVRWHASADNPGANGGGEACAGGDELSHSVADYQPGDTTSIFLNLRVADIHACYEQWKAKGGKFLTPPIDRASGIRCYFDAVANEVEVPAPEDGEAAVTDPAAALSGLGTTTKGGHMGIHILEPAAQKLADATAKPSARSSATKTSTSRWHCTASWPTGPAPKAYANCPAPPPARQRRDQRVDPRVSERRPPRRDPHR